MPTINAGSNPALANKIIDDIVNAAPVDDAASRLTVQGPPETVIDLPGGYFTATGEIVTEAEVRELTGRDEEAIAKTASVAATLQMILTRGTVRIGAEKATETVLDNVLAGDRDWLLLNIYATTFGREVSLTPFCVQCEERVEVKADILEVVPVTRLEDMSERNFVVEISNGSVIVELPTGRVQRAMLSAAEKTGAELSSILIKGCVVEMNGLPILRDSAILDLPIRDRRKISEAIMDHMIGPKMQDITLDCPACGTNMEVPLSLAALFQF